MMGQKTMVRPPSGGMAGSSDREEWQGRISVICVTLYIVIFAVESPIRYILNFAHLDLLIVLRDFLILGPLVAIVATDLFNEKIRIPILVFLVIAPIGIVVSLLNFGSLPTAALGMKTYFNCLLGTMVGYSLIKLDKRIAMVFMVVWILSVFGVFIEKFFVKFPWVGLRAFIGGVETELSRDWQITDSFQKRVGGFTKSSIQAASLIPLLAILSIHSIKRLNSFIPRNLIYLATIGAVFLTTQKGALAAITVVWMVSLLPRAIRIPAQAVAAVFALILDVSLPFITYGMKFPTGSGTSFSTSSIVLRIVEEWPDTFVWIGRMQIFPFGVGLGGIGEAQRFVSTRAYHYPDNMFLFLYASFGVMSVGLVVAIFAAIWRSLSMKENVAGCALSILIFTTLYGTVVSLMEDPADSLYIGAAVGALFARQISAEPSRTRVPQARASHAGDVASA